MLPERELTLKDTPHMQVELAPIVKGTKLKRWERVLMQKGELLLLKQLIHMQKECRH